MIYTHAKTVFLFSIIASINVLFLQVKNNNPKIDKRLPFDSKHKYSAIYINNEIYLKGASEVILPKCIRYLNNNNEEKILLKTNKFFGVDI